MNNPDKVKVIASVFGLTCSFDGRRWITPVTRLTDLLNHTTARISSHGNTYDRAARVFRKAGLVNNPDAQPHIVDWMHEFEVDELSATFEGSPDESATFAARPLPLAQVH